MAVPGIYEMVQYCNVDSIVAKCLAKLPVISAVTAAAMLSCNLWLMSNARSEFCIISYCKLWLASSRFNNYTVPECVMMTIYVSREGTR